MTSTWKGSAGPLLLVCLTGCGARSAGIDGERVTADGSSVLEPRSADEEDEASSEGATPPVVRPNERPGSRPEPEPESPSVSTPLSPSVGVIPPGSVPPTPPPPAPVVPPEPVLMPEPPAPPAPLLEPEPSVPPEPAMAGEPVVSPEPVVVPEPETPPEPVFVPEPVPVFEPEPVPPIEPEVIVVAPPSGPLVCAYPFDLGSLLGRVTGALEDVGSSTTAESQMQGQCGGYGLEILFSWTPPEAGTYEFDTHGSDFDTVLTRYQGLCETELDCSDDSSAGVSSELTATLAANDTQYFLLDAYSESGGNYVLNIGMHEPFTCEATDLGSALGQVSTGFLPRTAPGRPNECSGDGPTLVFSWQAPTDGGYTFSTTGSNFDTVLVLRDGSCDGAMLDCNDDFDGVQSQVQLMLVAGQAVAIELASFGGGAAGMSGARYILAITSDG